MQAPTVSTLKDYFEHGYDAGLIFEHPDYTFCEEHWGYHHHPSGITVWADPLDLRDTGDEEGQVLFHYTTQLAYQNITNEAKEKVELMASIRTEGETANAWWGKGVYSVPRAPDEWENKEQILDNNYRSMMKRDLELKGKSYVDQEYPPRVMFCIPILVEPAKAYDVSVRQTPEMVEKGKPPGVNLADKELSPPGLPARCCVVIINQTQAEEPNASWTLTRPTAPPTPSGTRTPTSLRGNPSKTSSVGRSKTWKLKRQGTLRQLNARGNLLHRVLQRAEAVNQNIHSTQEEKMKANLRVALVCGSSGRLVEAQKRLQEVVEFRSQERGNHDLDTLRAASHLSHILTQLGRFKHAYALQLHVMRNLPEGQERERLRSLSQLGHILTRQHKMREAEPLLMEAHRGRRLLLGETHFDTLQSQQDLALVCASLQKPRQAVEHYREVLKHLRHQLEKTHPASLQCQLLLAQTLASQGNYDLAEKEYDHVSFLMSSQLGAAHPKTLAARVSETLTFCDQGKLPKAMKLWRQRVETTGYVYSVPLLLDMGFHLAHYSGFAGIFLVALITLLLYGFVAAPFCKLGSGCWDTLDHSPWTVIFIPLWVLQGLHLLFWTWAVGGFRQLRHWRRHVMRGMRGIRNRSKSGLESVVKTLSRRDETEDLASLQEHAQVLDRVGLKTIASMLVISVLLALRLDVAEAFPWPPLFSCLIMSCWFLLELNWLFSSSIFEYHSACGYALLLALLRWLSLLLPLLRIEGIRPTGFDITFTVLPAFGIFLISLMSCIDGFIKEGCWSVLACAIALAENWDLRRYLARAMLALLYVATALGVVYTGEINPESSPFLATLPLLSFAAMPTTALCVLRSQVILRRPKKQMKLLERLAGV
ncbi:unnamed protein product [Durusdinium trenchii]